MTQLVIAVRNISKYKVTFHAFGSYNKHIIIVVPTRSDKLKNKIFNHETSFPHAHPLVSFYNPSSSAVSAVYNEGTLHHSKCRCAFSRRAYELLSVTPSSVHHNSCSHNPYADNNVPPGCAPSGVFCIH